MRGRVCASGRASFGNWSLCGVRAACACGRFAEKPMGGTPIDGELTDGEGCPCVPRAAPVVFGRACARRNAPCGSLLSVCIELVDVAATAVEEAMHGAAGSGSAVALGEVVVASLTASAGRSGAPFALEAAASLSS